MTLGLILHWVTTGKVATIQERIKLFSNLYEIFRKRVKLIFFLINFFYREWGRLSWPELWISTKTLKPKAGESLISNVIKKYYGKHVPKKIFLRKCHFAFILHFALATQGYIREKGIFQAGMILFTNYYHKALHLRCCSSPRSVCGTIRG